MSEDTSILTNLLSLYMEYVVEIGTDEPNLEGYCSFAEIDTTLFYEHFDTIQDIEKKIWGYMLDTAIETITSDPQYAAFNQDEKLLSFLYTFFENLSLSRGYFVRHLESRKGLRQKRGIFSILKSQYSNYIVYQIFYLYQNVQL